METMPPGRTARRSAASASTPNATELPSAESRKSPEMSTRSNFPGFSRASVSGPSRWMRRPAAGARVARRNGSGSETSIADAPSARASATRNPADPPASNTRGWLSIAYGNADRVAGA